MFLHGFTREDPSQHEYDVARRERNKTKCLVMAVSPLVTNAPTKKLVYKYLVPRAARAFTNISKAAACI
jgi:hypothetical protein